MKKTQLLGLLLVAACAFSALLAASAFALTVTLAEWLKAADPVTTNELAETEGELLFENVLLGASFLCSGIFDGTVGADGATEVTEVLTLGKVLVAELDPGVSGTGIACTPLVGCTSAEIWAVNLPFKSTLVLDTEDGLFYNQIKANDAGLFPAYFLLCTILGINATELCESVASFQEISNAADDVEGLGAFVPLATCAGNALDGLIENNASNVALTKLVSGAALAASE